MEQKELTCEYGHQCTSGCNNDFDCPCGNEHYCDVGRSEGEGCGECETCLLNAAEGSQDTYEQSHTLEEMQGK